MSARTRSVLAALACFGGIVLLLLMINPNLFINPGTNLLIDPWVYTGYFLSLPSQLQMFQGTYYGSRLSWLLPGFVVHRTFPPLVANYILHLSCFGILLVATYRLCRRAATVRSAVLVTLVMAWNPIVLAAMSWDYVDGAGIAGIVATLWCLEEAVHSPGRGWAWSGAAGFIVAGLITVNLFLAVLLPVFALFVVLRSNVSRVRVPALAGLGAAAGLLVMFGALAFVNTRLGGAWLFLAPQMHEAQTLVSSRNPWQFPDYSWLAWATWLVLPAVAVAAALRASLQWVRAPAPFTFGMTMQWVLLAAATLWIVVQIVSTPVLQISYYSSYLAPLAILALPLAGPAFDDRDERVIGVAVATIVVLVAGHWLILADPHLVWRAVAPASILSAIGRVDWIGPAHEEAALATIVALVAGCAAVAVVSAGVMTNARWMAFTSCLTLTFLAVPLFWPAAGDTHTKARYEGTVAAHRFISQRAGGRKLRVWYRLAPDEIRPFKNISSTYLWGYVLVNENLPALTPEQAATLNSQTRLVFLLQAPGDAEQARGPLRAAGFDYRVVAQTNIGTGDDAFCVVVTDLIPVHESD